MTTNNETKMEGNATTGTAGIPAGANANIPQHILDFCNRIYPPHYGSAYDGQRAHLIAKRMQIERDLVGRDVPGAPPSVIHPTEKSADPERTTFSTNQPIPSMESILSMLRAQTQTSPQMAHPGQSRDNAETHPRQSRDNGGTEPGQTRNNPATDPQQQPGQNTQPTANPRSAHRGHESKIDALSPAAQQIIADLLDETSLNQVRFILSKPGPHGPAINLSRNCLDRYRHRLLREKAKTRAAEAKQFVEELLANPSSPDDQLAKAITHIFHTRLLETINDPACALEDTLKAIQTCERLRQKS